MTIQVANKGLAVTPSDSTVLAPCSGLYVGVTGNVNVQFASTVGVTASNALFVAVPAGTILPIRANKVFATSTTATSIVALY